MGLISEHESVSYDPETETYRAHHEWESGGTLSETVLEAIGVATERDPWRHPPLQRTIDVDSLDKLYEPRPGATARQNGGCLTFTFGDCDVTVYWDGRVDVKPRDGVG